MEITKESITLNHEILETYTELIVDHVFKALYDKNVNLHLGKLKASDCLNSNLLPLYLDDAKNHISKNHTMLNDIILEHSTDV